jgi:hypothetical protein
MKPESVTSYPNTPSIAEVQAQFDNWRKTRRKRGKIPDQLWEAAVELAGLHGISKVASVLRLNYDRLKKRFEKASLPAKQNHDASVFPFIELTPIPGDRFDNCVIDLKRPDGSWMHIQLRDASSAPHLSALVQTFTGRHGA